MIDSIRMRVCGVVNRPRLYRTAFVTRIDGKTFSKHTTRYITYTVHAASLRDMITSKRTEKQTMRYVDGIRTAKRIPVYRSRPTHRRDN